MKNHYSKILQWLTIFFIALICASCAGQAPLLDIPKIPPPPVKLVKAPRVVLVLGSGGARGYAHLGVLYALQEAHIPVDAVVGASAGSVIAALYSDSGDAANTYQIMMRTEFWDFADISNVPHPSGLIKGYHLENFLLNHMQARDFSQLKKKLVLATTDLNTGETYPIESGPIAPAVLASGALPGAVQPVHLYGRTLIDGGVSDPVPVDLAKKLHPKIIIAVNICAETPNCQYTSALKIFSHSYDIIWQRLTELSQVGADVIIRPHVGDTGTFEFSKKQQMYLEGYEATRKKLPEIRRLLAKQR